MLRFAYLELAKALFLPPLTREFWIESIAAILTSIFHPADDEEAILGELDRSMEAAEASSSKTHKIRSKRPPTKGSNYQLPTFLSLIFPVAVIEDSEEFDHLILQDVRYVVDLDRSLGSPTKRLKKRAPDEPEKSPKVEGDNDDDDFQTLETSFLRRRSAAGDGDSGSASEERASQRLSRSKKHADMSELQRKKLVTLHPSPLLKSVKQKLGVPEKQPAELIELDLEYEEAESSSPAQKGTQAPPRIQSASKSPSKPAPRSPSKLSQPGRPKQTKLGVSLASLRRPIPVSSQDQPAQLSARRDQFMEDDPIIKHLSEKYTGIVTPFSVYDSKRAQFVSRSITKDRDYDL